MPDIAVPEILVQYQDPDKSAAQLEEQMAEQLRVGLSRLAAIEEMYSETKDGSGVLRLRFKHDTDVDIAFLEVNEAIDRAIREMPNEVERPIVMKTKASDIPVFYLNITPDSAIYQTEEGFLQLSELVDNVYRRQLEMLESVAMVDVSGMDEPEIVFTPDEKIMASLRLTLADLKQKIEAQEISATSFSVKEGRYEKVLKLSKSIEGLQSLKDTYISVDGRSLQLKELGQWEFRNQEPEGITTYNGKRCISLALIKQSSARMDNMKKEVEGRVNHWENTHKGIAFDYSINQATFLEVTMSSLMNSLLVGGFLAFFVMFFFLKSFRAPMLMGITLPFSIVLSLIVIFWADISINIISLSGMILGAGMMVDNSIIVIDNITQYKEKGYSLGEACVRGTNEVIRPLISSVLTTTAVFLPLIFLSGMAGALFYDQALTVTIGLSVSLAVAVIVLPVYYRLTHKSRGKELLTPTKKPAKAKKVFLPFVWVYRWVAFGLSWMKYGVRFAIRWLSANLKKMIWLPDYEGLYEKVYYWVFRHKAAAFLVFISLIGVDYLLINVLEKRQMPETSEVAMVCKIDWNEPISLDENRRRVDEVTTFLMDKTAQQQTWVGAQEYLLAHTREQAYTEAEVYLRAHTHDSLSVVQEQLGAWLSKQYPAVRFTMEPPPSLFTELFPQNVAPLRMKVRASKGALDDQITEVMAVVDSVRMWEEGQSNRPLDLQKELVIIPDTRKAFMYQVEVAALSNKLQSLINKYELMEMRTSVNTLQVVTHQRNKTFYDIINEANVLNTAGEEVPLRQLVQIMTQGSFKKLYADDAGRFLALGLDVEMKDYPAMSQKVEQLIRQFNNLEVNFDGSIFSNQEMIEELTIVLIVSLLFLYFILAAQFESVWQPLIVLAEVPLSFAGGLFLLWAWGGSINLVAMIGLVVVMGIIINDSILKIDTINRLRKEDYLKIEDAIHQAGLRRIKPILMTSMTTILSLLPFLFGNDFGSEIQRPMALVIIGGMTFGTLVSLYFVPLIYWWASPRYGADLEEPKEIEEVLSQGEEVLS
ncbi:efflux RND transporter permease subunit [Algivirga pacifica]|uniref:Efflux RND transporter permease subunit n=2 Tax=Algivirga pacifica TaxID=1162670 RepID=A0ABP9DK43_9BACT